MTVNYAQNFCDWYLKTLLDIEQYETLTMADHDTFLEAKAVVEKYCIFWQYLPIQLQLFECE